MINRWKKFKSYLTHNLTDGPGGGGGGGFSSTGNPVYDFFIWVGTKVVEYFMTKPVEATFRVIMGVTAFKQYKAMEALKKQGQELLLTKYGTGGGIPVLYGLRRVGGTVVFMDTANAQKELFVVYVFCDGESEQITDLQIDNRDINDLSVFRNGYLLKSDKANNLYGSGATDGSASAEIANILGSVGGVDNPRMVFNLHHGADDQTADPMLTGVFNGTNADTVWSSDHRLRGLTYIATNYEFDNNGMFQGIPGLTTTIRGRKIYDPRLDSTQTGGSGSHRSDDDSTWAWSNNPALCLLDYLTNDKYGKGLSYDQIDIASFMDSADDCDEDVTPIDHGSSVVVNNASTASDRIILESETIFNNVKIGQPITFTAGATTYFSGQVIAKRSPHIEEQGESYQTDLFVVELEPGSVTTAITTPTTGSLTESQKRFECNAVIDTDKSVLENAQDLIRNMRGIFTYTNGKYHLKVEGSETPVVTLDEDDIIDSGIELSMDNKETKFNRVEVEFYNANKKYEADTVIVEHEPEPPNQDDHTFDDNSENLETRAVFPFVTNQRIAYNHAYGILKRSRAQKSVSFVATPKVMKAKVGEVISITNSNMDLTAEQYRITQMQIQPDLNVKVSAVEYQGDIYGWQSAPDEDIKKPRGPVDPYLVNAPTGINFTQKNGSAPAFLSWTNPDTYPSYQFRVKVYDQANQAGNVVREGIVQETRFELPELKKANGYSAEVTSINTLNHESEPGVLNTFNVTVDPVGNSDIGSGAVDTDEINQGAIGGMQFTTTKAYYGTGTFNNSNTPFYVDTSSNFSLGSALSFDGTTLTIGGYATDTDISDFITGSEVNANVTSISGGVITTGTIDASVVSVTNLTADNITAGSLDVDRLSIDGTTISTSGGNLVVGTINQDNISVTNLSSIAANLGTITSGSISIDTSASIKKFEVSTSLVKIGSGRDEPQLRVATGNVTNALTFASESGEDGDKVSFALDDNGTITEKAFIKTDTGSASFQNLTFNGNLISGSTTVISSARQLQNIASLDATTTTTIQNAITGGTGDINSVVAGTNLTGGGTSGDVTLNLATNLSGLGTIDSGAITTSDSLTITGANRQVKFTGTGGPLGLEFGDTEANPNFRIYYRTTPNTLTFEDSGANAKHTFDLDGDYTAGRDISVTRNLTVSGDFTVNGTTVTLNTATLDVEDKNITLNYGAGDTSASANGAGITIQDAVNSTTDATILWDATNDEFDFSHGLNISGNSTFNNTVTVEGTTTFNDDAIFSNDALFGDNDKAIFGASNDLRIFHDGNNSIITQDGTGGLFIRNTSDDENIVFQSDDGSGGQTTYFYLDGSSTKTLFLQDTRHNNNVKASFGNGSPLQIYHDGSNSYIQDAGTGNLYIEGTNLILRAADDSRYLQAVDGASGYTALYHPATDGQKLATTSTGVQVTGTVTATSFSGSGANLTGIVTLAGNNVYTGEQAYQADLVLQTGGRIISVDNFSIDASGSSGQLIYNRDDEGANTFDFIKFDTTVLTLDDNVNVKTNLHMNGTEIISTSRNLTNIASANIGGGTSYFSEKLLVQGLTRIAHGADGFEIAYGTGYGNHGTLRHDDQNFIITMDRTSGTGNINLTPYENVNITTGALEIGGTSVISANRNLTNIGTYSGSGDMTISKNGTPILTVETSQNAGQDALLKIRGARTSSSTSDIAKIQFDNKTSSAYTMAEIVARDPQGAHTQGRGKLIFRTSNGGTLSDALTLDRDLSATFAGTISSGAITSSGAMTINEGNAFTDLNIKSDRTSGNIGGVNFVNASDAVKGQIYGHTDGTVRIASGGSTVALTLDASQNATFAGDIELSKNDPVITLNDSGTSSTITGQSGNILYKTSSTNRDHVFYGVNNEKFRVTGDGILQVGSSQTTILTADRQLQNIASLDATTTTTIENAISTSFTGGTITSDLVLSGTGTGVIVVDNFELNATGNNGQITYNLDDEGDSYFRFVRYDVEKLRLDTDVDLKTNLHMNGTEIINTSRDLTNIGSISATDLTTQNNLSIASIGSRDLVTIGSGSRAGAIKINDIAGANYFIAGGGFDLTFYKNVSGTSNVSVMQFVGANASDNTPDVSITNNLTVGGTISSGAITSQTGKFTSRLDITHSASIFLSSATNGDEFPKVNWDARSDGGDGAMVHKWNRNDANTGYPPYYENWYDGNSYHKIGVVNNSFVLPNSNLGIGTTAIGEKLTVAGSIKSTARAIGGSSTAGVTLSYDSSNSIAKLETWTSKPFSIETAGVERMRIDGTHGDLTLISSFSGGTNPLRIGYGSYASYTTVFQIDDNGNVSLKEASQTGGNKIHMPRAGGITFYGDESEHHGIFSRNNTNAEADDILITSYGAFYIDLDSNNNNGSGADFIITRHNSTSLANTIFQVNGENKQATFYGHAVPSQDDEHDLGTNSLRWRNLNVGDIQLNNTGSGGNEVDGTEGRWTIQEGADDLFLINRNTNRKYRFKLQEV